MYRYETEYKPKEVVAPFVNLLNILKEKNVSLNTLAYHVGTYPEQFRRWRMGSNPTFGLLLRVANVLEVNITELLDKSYVDDVKYNQEKFKVK